MSELDRMINHLMDQLKINGRRVYCYKEENEKLREMAKSGEKLPEGVLSDSATGNYYRLLSISPNEPKLNLLVQLQKLKYVRTIKNCAVFFTVLLILVLIIIFFIIVH